MRVSIISFLLILPTYVLAQNSGHFGAPKFVPEDKKKLLIIGQDLGSVGGMNNYFDGYIDHLEHYPAGVTTYTGFPGVDGLYTRANWGAGDIHAEAYIRDTKFDNTTIIIGLHLVDQLDNIIKGRRDKDIIKLGNWIKEKDRPIFLRIGYEFDGPWNSYIPSDYKAAWKYIVHKFDEIDIRNVAYVWQSAGINTTKIDRWYPGDEYVNWVGYSLFDGSNPGQSIRDFAEEHDKPVMIAESTPRRDLKEGLGQTHWSAWYDPAFQTIYDNDRIQAFAYINADWESQPMWQGQGWGDSRVQVNSYIEDAWRKEIAKDRWLLASEELFDLLQFQMWQDSVIITSIPEVIDKKKVVIKTDQSLIIISLINGKLMNGLSVLDFQGRELIRKEERKSEYFFSPGTRNKHRGLIIRVFKDHDIFTQKVILN